MTTIVVWLGSGFAFAVGIACGVWVCSVGIKRANTQSDDATQLLRERNEIGRMQVSELTRIADLVEEMSDAVLEARDNAEKNAE